MCLSPKYVNSLYQVCLQILGGVTICICHPIMTLLAMVVLQRHHPLYNDTQQNTHNSITKPIFGVFVQLQVENHFGVLNMLPKDNFNLFFSRCIQITHSDIFSLVFYVLIFKGPYILMTTPHFLVLNCLHLPR